MRTYVGEHEQILVLHTPGLSFLQPRLISAPNSVPVCFRLVKFQPGPPILLGFASFKVASILVILKSPEKRSYRYPCPLENDAQDSNFCFRVFLHSSQRFPWSTQSKCYEKHHCSLLQGLPQGCSLWFWYRFLEAGVNVCIFLRMYNPKCLALPALGLGY